MIAIARNGEAVPNPGPDFRLEPDDIIVLLGAHRDLDKAVDPADPFASGTQRSLVAEFPVAGCRLLKYNSVQVSLPIFLPAFTRRSSNKGEVTELVPVPAFKAAVP